MSQKCMICKRNFNDGPFRICMDCLDKEFPSLVYIARLIKDEPLELWDTISRFYHKKFHNLSLFYSENTRKELERIRKERKKAKKDGTYYDSNEYENIRKWVTKASAMMRKIRELEQELGYENVSRN